MIGTQNLERPATRIAELDWKAIAASLDERGYAIVPDLLAEFECRELIAGYDDAQAFRKTINMARYRFGSGEYKYWAYPLPDLVQELRRALYPNLAPIVNEWFRKLGIAPDLPTDFEGMQARCHDGGQTFPTPLMLKYGAGGYNTLHQDLYGEVYFPVQAVINLNQPGVDFDGGEFVVTEQLPRAQSRATVLTPNRGDMIIFTTNFRPVAGKRGYYRSRMKHGVSEVKSGHRHTLGIIFHDAET